MVCMVERRGVHRVLVGKPEGRPRYTWENNIKMYFQELAQNWLACQEGLCYME